MKVIHYPNLKTVINVENVLKDSGKFLSREEIKRSLDIKIMHQTLNFIIHYLEERGLVEDTERGVRWTGRKKK